MATVLVVEEETAYQKILKDSFEKEKFEVILASEVKQASSEIATKRPDIILLDIMLPGGLNGFDFLEQLKANEKTRDIPVIIITNLSSEEKVAKEVGAVSYFVKSETTIEQIISKVKEILGGVR
jgi:DNA-binding response OmpR family regulator